MARMASKDLLGHEEVVSLKGSIRSKLIGSWELVSYIAYSEKSASNFVHPMGEDATGILMYTPDGYMSGQLQSSGKTTSPSTLPYGLGLDETGRYYTGYTGRFYLDESGAEPILYHNMSISNILNWLGETQRRFIELKDDQLILRTGWTIELEVS